MIVMEEDNSQLLLCLKPQLIFTVFSLKITKSSKLMLFTAIINIICDNLSV